jgi:hypothetical protein
MKYTPPELTVMEPMYVSQPEHAEVEEMDWEPEAPPTDEVTLASERLSMLSLPRTEEPTEELFRVAGPGLGFASDSVFAKKPSYKHSALASDDRSRSALPASFLRVLDMKVLRATYAICFLLRILFSVHVGTSRSVSATARLLADAATVAEVLSVVAWHIRSRTLPMRVSIYHHYLRKGCQLCCISIAKAFSSAYGATFTDDPLFALDMQNCGSVSTTPPGTP